MNFRMLRHRKGKLITLLILGLTYLASQQIFAKQYYKIFREDQRAFSIACPIYQYRYFKFKEQVEQRAKENGTEYHNINKQVVAPIVQREKEKTESCTITTSLTINDFLNEAKIAYKENRITKHELELLDNELKNVDESALSDPNTYIEEKDFFYFSVVTSTTTGYGDIIPLSDKARDMAKFQIIFSTLLIGVFFAVVGFDF